MMDSLNELLVIIVGSIVDDENSVEVTSHQTDKGILFEVTVGKDDLGKVIGKQGRIANAIRTVLKASGAKLSERVMVNILNKPLEVA
jgi:predicted RNA-binding protein YlqC (UPF0109 family)